MSTTPFVQYDYSEADTGNHSRLTKITYPDGYELDYNYATGVDDNISRLTSISDSTGTLESYAYQGEGTALERNHVQPGLNLATTLDDFGRISDFNWTNGSGSVSRYAYGYDAAGNRPYKEDPAKKRCQDPLVKGPETFSSPLTDRPYWLEIQMDYLILFGGSNPCLSRGGHLQIGDEKVSLKGIDYYTLDREAFFEWLFNKSDSVVGVEICISSSDQIWSQVVLKSETATFDFSGDFARFWLRRENDVNLRNMQDWECYLYQSVANELLIALNLHLLSEDEIRRLEGIVQTC